MQKKANVVMMLLTYNMRWEYAAEIGWENKAVWWEMPILTYNMLVRY